MHPQTFVMPFQEQIPIQKLDGIYIDKILFQLDLEETACYFALQIVGPRQYIEIIRTAKQRVDIARPLKMDIDSYFYTESYEPSKLHQYIITTDSKTWTMTPRVIDIFFEELRTLTFNNYFGLFLSKRMKILEVRVSSKQCCVCYEITNRKTSCNHGLCIRCLMMLPQQQQKCPYCRQMFVMRQTNNIRIYSDLNPN